MAAELGNRWLAAAVVVLGLAGVFLARPGAVHGECDGPLPSLIEAAPSATSVVVGDVVAVRAGGLWDPGITDGLSSRFTVHVSETLRGTTQETLEISDLPTQPCAPVVGAHLGDRVAIALGGRAFTPPITVNAIAWLAGMPMPGGARTTAAAVRAAVAVGVPDTGTAQVVGSALPDVAPVLAIAGVAGLLAGTWRATRRMSRARRFSRERR